MASGALVVITCSEPDPRIDASRFFNLTASSNSRIVKTAGGRTGTVVNELYAMDQAAKLGMVVVLQHTGEDPFRCGEIPPSISVHVFLETGEELYQYAAGCTWSLGNVEANVRSDISDLKNSSYVRDDLPVIGYTLDVTTGQLKEVNTQRSTQDEAARKQVLENFQDFAPFWG